MTGPPADNSAYVSDLQAPMSPSTASGWAVVLLLGMLMMFLRPDRTAANRRRNATMGLGDKIENAAEKAGGKGKEAAGAASGDDSLKTEGQADQAKGDVKQAGEKVKDAFKKD